MAISNSIGSNIFDILIGLGLPWFVSTVIVNTNSTIRIYSGGIFYSSAILLSNIIILISIFIFNKWKLDKKVGIGLFILWVVTTTLTCLLEFDVFGKFSIPLC